MEEADLEAARATLAAIERAAEGPPKRCASCGEESPASFELCWACGKIL